MSTYRWLVYLYSLLNVHSEQEVGSKDVDVNSKYLLRALHLFYTYVS